VASRRLPAILGLVLSGVFTVTATTASSPTQAIVYISLAMFFLAVGMLLDLSLIIARPFFVVGIAAAVIGIKAGLISLLSRLFKHSWTSSIRLGLLLSQAGEFGFVLFAQAASARLIAPEAASLFGAVVTLSMATTPFLMRFIDFLERREELSAEGLDGPDKSPTTSAIVVGFGRFGQTVSQMLMAKSIGVTIIDKSPKQIERVEEFGYKVYYGDGLRIDLLRIAGAETAKVIAFCNDNHEGELTRDALAAVLDAFPQAAIMVRVYDRLDLINFDDLDLAFAERELFEGAVAMGRAALKAYGISAPEIDRVDREYRMRDCERLERQSATGDLHAGQETSFSPDRALPEAETHNPA